MSAAADATQRLYVLTSGITGRNRPLWPRQADNTGLLGGSVRTCYHLWLKPDAFAPHALAPPPAASHTRQHDLGYGPSGEMSASADSIVYDGLDSLSRTARYSS